MKKILFLSLIMAFLLPAISWAAWTAAGTQIKNQASATYTVDGNSLSTLSNEVITTVDPRYKFEITPDGATTATPGQTQTATVGNIVYFPYKLLNESNTSAVFTLNAVTVDTTAPAVTPTNIKIYRDDNRNGIVEPGEPEIAINDTTGQVGRDEYFYFVLSYTVPNGTPNTTVMNLSPRFLDPSNNPDTVLNYSRTTLVSDAVLTAVMSASPTSVNPNDTVTYTISGSNTGNKDATTIANVVTVDGTNRTGIFLDNTFPAQVTYTYSNTNPPVASGPAGTIVVYFNGTTWTATPVNGTTYTAIGLLIPSALSPGQNYSLEYDVTVNSNAVGIIPDNATIRYNNTAGAQTKVSNTIDVTVIPSPASYDVAVGPQGDPEAIPANDITTIPTAPAGSTQTFTNTVRNTGPSQDTFNLSATIPAALPSGAVVQFLYVDGTPLIDSNGDGKVDLLLPSLGERDFLVRVFIPGTTPALANVDFIVTAASASQPTVTDTTTDRIASITPADWIYGVNDGINNGTVGVHTIADAQNPGVTVQYRLDLVNQGGMVDTFNLSATGVPTGYVVTFFRDVDGNGTPDVQVTELTLPVDNPATPAVREDEGYIIARVQIPANAAAATNNIVFESRSTLNPTIVPGADQIVTLALTINPVLRVTFEPDRSGTAVAGGTLTYQHIVRNEGNASTTFRFQVPNSPLGWSYVILDADNADAVLTPVTSTFILAPGASKNIKVRAFIPTGAAPNAVDTATITVENTGATISDNVIDTTVVISGVLQLTKNVSVANAQPGDPITYTIDYKNLSTFPVVGLVVRDAVPTYTTFDSATTIAGVTVAYSVDGVDYTAPAGPTVKFLRWTFSGNVTAGYDSAPDIAKIGFTVTVD